MNSGAEVIINKLWNDFQSYIKGNWTLPIEYGIKDGKPKKRILAEDFGEFKPFGQVQPQIKFCQVLCEILKHSLAQKDKEGFKVPHENTMRIFLKAGLSPTTQKNTLNAFAGFLGFEHWDDYRRKNSRSVITPLKTGNDNSETIVGANQEIKAPALKNNKRKLNARRRLPAFFIFIIILIVAGITAVSLQNKKRRTLEKSKIINVLKQANKAEFEAYSKLPVLDTLSLDSFFVNSYPEGSARISIITYLTRRKKAGHILRSSISYYNLISLSVDRIQDTVAYITTTEKWNLHWFDTLQKREVFVYDTTNNHKYILVKRNSTWKILMDDYEGHIRRSSFVMMDPVMLKYSKEKWRLYCSEQSRQENGLARLPGYTVPGYNLQ